VTKSYPTSNNGRWHSGHIDAGRGSRLHSRDGNPRGSSNCTRCGKCNNHDNHNWHHGRHSSPGRRRASGRAGPPRRNGNLARNRRAGPAAARLRRIGLSRRSGHRACNDRSVPCRSKGHGHNRTVLRAGVFAARASAPDTLPGSDNAPGDSVAVILLLAFERLTPAALNSAGTGPLLVAADESVVLVADARFDDLAVRLPAHGAPPVALIAAEAVLSPLVFAAFSAPPVSAAEPFLAPAVARAFAFPLPAAEGVLALASAFAVFAPAPAAEPFPARSVAGFLGLALTVGGCALAAVVFAVVFAVPAVVTGH